MAFRSTFIEAACLLLVWAVALLLLVGCSSEPAAKPRAAAAKPATAGEAEAEAAPLRLQRPKHRRPERTLADLMEQATDEAAPTKPVAPAETPPRGLPDYLRPERPIDEAAAVKAGIRKIAGRHLTLYTDLPPSPEIDALPKYFDQAVPQWCAYFGVDPARAAAWQVRTSLIGDRAAFEQAGLLPADLPPFRHGYALNNEIWLNEQPSDYYRRHLVLHEGTHAFMAALLGGGGPPWYMEGMAELLATHAMHDGQVRLNHFPKTRDEVPMLGRIKLVQDAFAAKRAMQLSRVVQYDARAHLQDEPYGWCWAAAAFLDGHPRYRDRFRTLKEVVAAPDFNAQFQKLYAEDWNELNAEWQLFVSGLEHGYDLERTAVDFTPGQPLAGKAEVEVAADRGWQNTGLRLEAGKTYRLDATGRFQVAQAPEPWWSEPNGVTIRYYQGRPLGVLLAAVVPDGFRGLSPLLIPTVIGGDAQLTPQQTGTLFLRINDSAAELHDNTGVLRAVVRE